jgi:hypothetical protein
MRVQDKMNSDKERRLELTFNHALKKDNCPIGNAAKQ